jgi:Cu+-exporting ATPase
MVEEAQSGKAAVQRLADRCPAVFVPIVIALAVATLGFWLGQGSGCLVRVYLCGRGVDHRLPVRARTGHTDGLAGWHWRGAQLGIVISGPEALESRGHIDTIVLDKTGTVTEGRMTVVA